MAQGVKGALEHDSTLKIKLPSKLKEEAAKALKKNNTDFSKVIRQFLQEYVEKNK